MAALALDLRGHGDSEGALDAGAMDDVLAGLDALAERGHAPLGVRGSSMGGMLALHAPDRDRRVRAVVAICPARPDGLARMVDDPWPFEFDPEGVVQTADGVARGYWHAMGDERVPWSSTFALAASPPIRCACASPRAATTAASSTTRRDRRDRRLPRRAPVGAVSAAADQAAWRGRSSPAGPARGWWRGGRRSAG